MCIVLSRVQSLRRIMLDVIPGLGHFGDSCHDWIGVPRRAGKGLGLSFVLHQCRRILFPSMYI